MKKIHLYLFTLLFLVTACGTNTSVTGSYKDAAAPQKAYSKVFIVAISDRAAARQTVENGLAQLIASRGSATVKSSDVLPPNFRSGDVTKDKELILKKIRETNCDGILTVALVNQEHETRYVPGTTNYYPMGFGYYGGFGTYYTYGYNNFYTPGYYTDDKIYYLESNLYDAESEKMVWSVQSKTYNPASLDDFLAGYNKALSAQMDKDNVMMSSKK
ncbi:hypothetical protein [Flavobacterium sp. AG291]|uniref:hypothetical protein n=1 Tax=Flavobacterium sp. AG291 TaxID=2184000 RepID=UPI000E0C33BF|nr:hypothetical protein [Flavobacterium sp. AG291]RDI10240.1 hypothetical protein DEU42_10856 [Flavobacterium sp. AG291]